MYFKRKIFYKCKYDHDILCCEIDQQKVYGKIAKDGKDREIERERERERGGGEGERRTGKGKKHYIHRKK